MNILSVDTTTKKASVTLKVNEKEYTNIIDNPVTHSEKFLPLIDKTLKEANLTLDNIDNYLILNGPGSFTGIRISLATIKAINYIYNRNIFSISSLEALAYIGYKKTNKNYIISFIDAKNDRVYFNIYKIENKENKININNLLEIKNEYFDDAKNIISQFLKENNIDINNTYSIGNISNIDLNYYPTTEDLIEIYDNIYDRNTYTFDTFNLNAIYARPSQAERVKNGEK